jgi:hypothetical protein
MILVGKMKKATVVSTTIALMLVVFSTLPSVSASSTWYPPYDWQRQQRTGTGWCDAGVVVNKDTGEIKVYAWSNPFSAARAHGWVGAYITPSVNVVVTGMKAKFYVNWKNNWGWPNQAWAKVEYQIYNAASGPIEIGYDPVQRQPTWDPSANALRRILVFNQWDTGSGTYEIDRDFSSSITLTAGTQYMIAFLFYCGSWGWASSGGATPDGYNYAKAYYITLKY